MTEPATDEQIASMGREPADIDWARRVPELIARIRQEQVRAGEYAALSVQWLQRAEKAEAELAQYKAPRSPGSSISWVPESRHRELETRCRDVEDWQRRAVPLVEYAAIELEARGFNHDQKLWEDGKKLVEQYKQEREP